MDQGPDQRRYQKAKEILQRAVDEAPANRRAWLDAACGDDVQLRAEVESLLAAYDEANSQFLAAPSASLIDDVERPSDEIDLAGTRVGAYRLERLIGRGGMGAVYLASRADGEFTKHVAVKFILPSIATPVVLKRFRAERQMLADIDHPNIARLIDGGTADGGMPFFIMEYVKGDTLSDTLTRGPLPVPSVIRMAGTVASVLETIHAKGLVFRDLKPSNIMLTPDAGTKLLDFGIAKIIRDDSGEQTTTSTEPGWIVGSPRYMSPEQATGEFVDARSDVFSFGVVAYEALTGRLPFDAKTRHEYVKKLLTTEPAPLPAAVPANLRAVIERCLKKDPADRFPSGKELAASVNAVASPVGPAPQSPSSRALRTTVAALVLALVAFVAYLATRPGRVAPAESSLLRGPANLLATWNSNEIKPRVSPNGKWVSFISNRDGRTKLWLIELAAKAERSIAPPAGDVRWHEWSPASDAIAYSADHGATTRLTIAPLGDENPRQFELPHRDPVLVRWIGNGVYYMSGGSLWRFDLAERRSREMTTQRGDLRLRGVDVSADERGIIFSASKGDLASLWRASIDGSSAVRLTEDRINPRSARWKGTSTRDVVFVSDEGDMVDIWQIDVSTKARHRLTVNDNREGALDVSADGAQLFYEQIMQRSNLAILDPSQQKPQSIMLTSDTLADLHPRASESGGDIVFQRSKTIDISLSPRTSTVRLNRDAFRGQGETVGEGYAPDISRDGQWIAYSKWTPAGTDQLWVASASDRSQKPIQVTGTLARPNNQNTVPWTRLWAVLGWADGPALYFVNRSATGPEIWKFIAGSGRAAEPLELVPAVDNPLALITDLQVSPDGTRLSYIVTPTRNDATELHVVDFARNRDEVVFREKSKFRLGCAGWTSDGELVVLRADPTGTLTDIVLLKDGRQTDAGRIRDATWGNVALDPRRRALYFTRESDAVHSLNELLFQTKAERQLQQSERHGASFSGLHVLRNGQIVFAAHSENYNILSNAFGR